jgi:lipopolysaccharide/colanic/teichoic acid biosynthesis glycosyltransferase
MRPIGARMAATALLLTDRPRRAAKRAFDIAVAVIGLIVFSPILLLSSLAIKLDSRGPIVCHQVCHGHD